MRQLLVHLLNSRDGNFYSAIRRRVLEENGLVDGGEGGGGGGISTRITLRNMIWVSYLSHLYYFNQQLLVDS